MLHVILPIRYRVAGRKLKLIATAARPSLPAVA
nr:MAG TPA_asm: hypothetical protein [Caudoviricetes sp.]